MNSLAKFKIATTYSNRHQTEEYINDIFGQNVVWEYDDEQHMCFCNILLSLDDDFGEVSTIGLSKLNLLGNNVDCDYVGTLDLPLNGSSRIERLGSVGGNENMNQIRQIIEVPEGDGIRTYIFTVVFNNLTGEVTTSNTSTYRDTYVEEITITTTDPETGETTSTTTTTNSQTGDETTSTTTYDENGTMTGSSTHTDYGDGGSYDSSQTYYDDGTISQDHDQTTNTDGSSVAHTTNYDENGDPTDGNTQWVDTSQNQNTQSYEYDENGDAYISGYDINTESNPNGGETLNNPINTGVLAFDGRDFDIHLKAKFYWNNLQYNSLGGGKFKARVNTILNLSAENENHKVNGFLVLFLTGNTDSSNYYTFTGSPVTGNSTYPTFTRVNKYLNDAASTVYNVNWHQQLNNSNACLGLANGATGNGTFTFDIQARSNVFTIVMKNASGNIIGKTVTKSNPNGQANLNFGNASFDDVTVELGHWDSVVDGVQYSFVYEVLEFNVTKLPENP